MSTNHTENFSLSQWEGTDSFSRADFNSDNNKIDSALKTISDRAGLGCYVHISSVTTEENVMSLNMDVSDIDFTKYLFVELTLDITSVCISGSGQHHLRLNNINTTGAYSCSDFVGQNITTTTQLLSNSVHGKYCLSQTLRFSPVEATGKISCIYPYYRSAKIFSIGMSTISTLTWSELQSFNYIASNENVVITPGSGLYLTGVLKPQTN